MNKKLITLIIVLTALCSGANAQPKNAYCSAPSHRGAGKMTVIDTTRIRVWYAFNADNVKDVSTYIDHQRLDIGKRVTKYYSDFLFRSDSLVALWHKSHPGAQSVPIRLGNGGKKPDTWSEYEYSDLFIENVPLARPQLRGVVCYGHPREGWTMEVRWSARSHSEVAGYGWGLSF